MSAAQSSKYIKIGDAAKLLGLSTETLRRWERAGKITFSRTPGGKRLFSEADLEAVRNLLKPTQSQGSVQVNQPPIQSNIGQVSQGEEKIIKNKKTFPKPSQKNYQYIKFFAVLALILGNITFFLQTPYPNILSAKLNVAKEQVQKKVDSIGAAFEGQNTNLKVAEIPPIQKTVLAQQSNINDYLAINGLATGQAISPTNLIINSSFEGGIANFSIIGQSTNTNTKVGNESVRSGTQALKIRDDFCINCQLGISQPKVNTVNGRSYVLSLYVRTSSLIGNPKLRIGLFGTVSTSDPLYLSQPANYLSYSQDRYEDHMLSGFPENEWVRLNSTFENLPLGKYPLVQVIDNQGGAIFIDDLSLNEKVSETEFALGVNTFNFPIEENNLKLGSNTISTDAFGNLSTSGNISAATLTLSGEFTNTGSGTFDSLTVTGNINSDDGALQTNGVTRIDNSGNLTAGTGSFSGDISPGLDATYDFGSESVRWLNGYFSGDVVVGDAVFKNDFRLTEGLRRGKHSIDMLNPRGEMIASFDEDGNFWVKGEINEWKAN